MKITATPFHQCVPICFKQIVACKPSGAVVCASKYLFRSNKRKNREIARVKAAIVKDFCLENMECNKFQLIFVTAEEVLSKPFLSSLKKRLPHRFTNQLYVCLF